MKLYQDGVSGGDIPKAVKQQRKNQKHRPGGLHPEEAKSSRGKNSYKKQRLEKIEAMLDNERLFQRSRNAKCSMHVYALCLHQGRE